MIPEIDYVVIEHVWPEIDCGTSYIRRRVGDMLKVSADIFSHGHEKIVARIRYRERGAKKWLECPMHFVDNDRWQGEFLLAKNGYYEYTILAWRDYFLSWAHDTHTKYNAHLDIKSELLEGKILLQSASKKAIPEEKKLLQSYAAVIDTFLDNGKKTENRVNLETEIFGETIKNVMVNNADRSSSGSYDKVLTVFVDRKKTEFASWYEMWARSQGTVEGKSATFSDMINRLDYIKNLGFDVVYLPPIHPIGETNRKGPNNSLECPPGSPGCPYAIGNKLGGHRAIDPELGTLDEFKRFVDECHKRDMEVALDFAVQASPDHPWVQQHEAWFSKRPDGTIKYAENPPKKYQDIYPINFDTEDKEGLWNELLGIIKFWIDHGVKIFRVDNPHTKPIYFWKWLIEQIHVYNPEVFFLAEAFTRPKVMKKLAKIGFSQSYTYFTWRNFKHELTDYFSELTQSEAAEYMIGNLFTNTPDILPEFLQNAPRQSFKIRAVLAGTLSSTWGMYNGFELCEGRPLPGKEEYIDSEKYDYKIWDWDRPGNIKDFIMRLNLIRKRNKALQQYRNLRFLHAENDNILFYEKKATDLSNIILTIVNLDPYHTHGSFIYVPIEDFNIGHDETYFVQDLISGEKYYWQGHKNYIELNPHKEPAHILRLHRYTHKEAEFDYF